MPSFKRFEIQIVTFRNPKAAQGMAMGIIWEVYLRATQKKGKTNPKKEEKIGKEIEVPFHEKGFP